MVLTKANLITLLQLCENVPDNAPIVSFYNFESSFDFYNKLNVKEITPEHYGESYIEGVDYVGPAVTID